MSIIIAYFANVNHLKLFIMKSTSIQSKVMKLAWKLFKAQEVRTMEMWSTCLKNAWYQVKNPALSFTEVYNKYYNGIINFLRVRINNVTIAEDLASETFMKVLSSLELYDSKYAVSTWIYSIAKNVLIDYTRTRTVKYNKEIKVESFVNDRGNETFQFVSDECDVVESNELQSQIKKAFENLNSKYKEVAQLALIEKIPQKEIAEMLGISLSNVKILVHRSKEILRNKLSAVRAMY